MDTRYSHPDKVFPTPREKEATLASYQESLIICEDMAPSKVYSFEEVDKHDKKTDCWVIISGKVYDVTSYLEDHPGSAQMLLAATGYDATKEFEDVGHSASAREIMKRFFVGEVDETSIPKSKSASAVSDMGGSKPILEKPGFLIKILQLLVPLLTLGLALAVRIYAKKE